MVECDKEVSPDGLRLGGLRSRCQYCVIPRRAFSRLTSINLASTQLSNRHFQQMMLTVTTLQRLDISNCPRLNQIAIFQAKQYLHEFITAHYTISGNKQFTVNHGVFVLLSGT